MLKVEIVFRVNGLPMGNCVCLHLLDYVMECDIFAIVQLVQFVAHVFKEQAVFLWVTLKPPFKQSQYELNTPNWNHSTLMDIDDIPSILEISYVGIRK